MKTSTTVAGTKDWLEAVKMKHIEIRAYIPDGDEQQQTTGMPKGDEPLFGTHIREAIEVIKNLAKE